LISDVVLPSVEVSSLGGGEGAAWGPDASGLLISITPEFKGGGEGRTPGGLAAGGGLMHYRRGSQ
jgi:hypothetical protein